MMLSFRNTKIPACLWLSCAAGSAAALPPTTLSRLYYANGSGENIAGVGLINYPFRVSAGNSVGGTAFRGFSINNSGASSVLVGVYLGPGFDKAVLDSASGGLSNVYLWAGAEGLNPDPGSVTVPSTDYVYDNGFGTSINNNGAGALSIGLRASQYAANPPASLTGVYFNKTALPVRAGDVVTAAGVAPGTTFGDFSTSGSVRINDSNVVMIAGPIVESGVTKNAIIKISLGMAGNLMGETLVAKEGGPVGAGPDTWSAISVAPTTCAMNNSGAVLFSGITAAGTNGIYFKNGFVATKGGTAPGMQTWGSLFAVPLDVANTGQFAFRGLIGGSPAWTETSDAGEGFGNLNGGGTTFSAQVTTGSGSISQINGTLSNDQDVDLYEIRIGDPNLPVQAAFSATTVPDAGSGFSGANFDTVLYLFEWQYNVNGNTRTGVGRCDDAAPGVMQSTLTTASLPSSHTIGRTYILGISTPKSRAWGNPTYGTPPATQELWAPEPGQIAVGGGMAFWADVAHGQIGRSSLSSATLLSPLTVTTPPAQTLETQTSDPASILLSDEIAVYDAGAGSKVFFYHSGYGDSKIQSCNTDGSGITDVIIPGGGVTFPDASGTSAMAVDSVNAKLYWANPPQTGALFCRINSSELDGSSATTLVTLANTDRVNAVAIDPTPVAGPGTGTLYWYNSAVGAISRSDLTGANIQSVATVAGVTSLAVDAAGRRLYYASSTGNVIGVINTDTLAALSPLAASPNAPVGVALDSAGGNLYWTTPLARMLQRSSVSAPSVQNWTSIGGDVGEYPADGPGAFVGYTGFVRNGAAGSTALPYSIKLTGASFASTKAMICRNNSINVDQGLAGLSPGYTTSPVRVSDRGVVAWAGAGTMYADQTVLMTNGANHIIGGANVGLPLQGSSLDLSMSTNGQHVLFQTYNGSQVAPSATLIQADFSAVPGCQADFNGVNGLSVQDIFDFLNGWFAGLPQTDFNGDGVISVQDIFDFLNAWFAGC
jgi:hypothetical protein